jgi:ligand-binding sensor domain-containing protein
MAGRGVVRKGAFEGGQFYPTEAASCLLQTQRMHMFLKLKSGMWKTTYQRLKARIATAARQELKSKRLAHQSHTNPV